MSLKETVDPKTGAVTWDWDGSSAPAPKPPAPKPQAAAPKPAAPKPQAQSNLLIDAMNATPIGWMSQLTGNSIDSIGAGIKEYQRTGDIGKAVTKAQENYGEGLQGPGAAKAVVRTFAGGGRDFLQNTSNLVQDVAAKVGVPGATPTSAEQQDTPFLGVLPPLPKIQSSGPVEDFGRVLVQVGLSVVPINRGLSLAGAGLKALPGGAKVAGAAQGVRGAIAASKPAQTIAKTPVVGPLATSLAENVTTKNALTGAIVDMLVSNPYEGRLYDHAERFYESISGTPLELPFEDLLKGNTSAIGLDARWGQAVDGAGLGTGLGFIWRQGKMAAAALRLRSARQGVDAGTAGALDVRKAQKDLQSAVKEFAEEVVDQGQAAMPKPTVQELIQQRLNNLEQVRTELKELPKVKRGAEGYKEYQAARKELLNQEKAINLDVQRLSVQELRDRAGRTTAAQGEPPVAQAATPEAVPSPVAQAVTPEVLPPSAAPSTAGRPTPLADALEANMREMAQSDARVYRRVGQSIDAQRQGLDQLDEAALPPAAVSDEAIKALEEAYPYKPYRGQTALDAAYERLNRVNDALEATRFQLEQLSATKPEPGASGSVARKAQRDWKRNWDKFTKQEAQIKDDLVVAQAAIDRLGPVARAIDAPPAAAAAPEPSVPSAGSSAPAAGPSAAEIRELDELLAKARADLPLEQRIALRDQTLAQKYGTGSPVEPPVAQAATPEPVASPAVVEAAPMPRTSPNLPDGEWATRFANSLENIQDGLKSGDVTVDDLIDNNILKIQSPSGNTQYVAAQPDLVEAYAAARDAFTRQELGRPDPMNTQAIKDWALDWIEKNGFGDGQEIRKLLEPLSKGLAGADQNEKALFLAAMYTDSATKAAGLSGKRWLNARLDPTANVSELAADLISAASAQQGAITSFTSLTSRLGRLLRVLQIDRNMDQASATAKRTGAPVAPVVDIGEEFSQNLADHQSKSLAETVGKPISQELTEAIETGVYTPKAVAELDLLAYSLEQAAVTPGYGKGFYDMLNKSVDIGARGLVMYRSAQLLSSGLTITTNAINNAVRLTSMPLMQALGASTKGGARVAMGQLDYAAQDFARARDSMLMYGQYVSNLHNAFRLGIESFKVGRSLYDLDASSVDFMDKLARRGSDMLMQPAGEWTLNTVPWVGVWDNTTWGRAQKAVWATLNLSTRAQVSADTFFKVLAGQSFEYARNLRPGLEAAIQMGLPPGSKEAWKFAKEYAQEMVDQQTRDVVVNGRTILDAVMEGPNAQTAMRWATFTDDITARMEKRTPTRGRELAMASGLKDEAKIEEYVQKYLSNNSEETPFWTGGPSFFPKTWQSLMDLNPVFTLIQPFNRTPGDIVKSTMRMTPLAPFVDTWWRDINSMDAFTRDRAMGEVAMGSAIIGLTTMGLVGGKVRITGGAPIDPDARRQWYEVEQKQPFSISVLTGENELGQATWSDWVPLRMFEPVTGLLGAIGQFHEIQASLTLEQRERLAGSLVLDTLVNVAAGQYSKTYFQGLVDLFEAAQGITNMDSGPNNRNPAMTLLAKIAASMVPGSSSLRTARRIDDPVVRRPVASQAEGIEGDPTGASKFAMRLFEETWQEIQNGVPGWSKELPSEVSWITGTPLMLTGPVGAQHLPADQPWMAWLYQYNPLSAAQMGPSSDDVVMLEMASLSGKGALFSGPRSTDFGRERRLDAWQMRDYKMAIANTPDETGLRLHGALEKEIRSPVYQSLPRETGSSDIISYRAARLNMIVERYRRMGRTAFLEKYPDLRDELDRVEYENQRRKRAVLGSGSMETTTEDFVEAFR